MAPTSGFVCGICARNDMQRGAHKAPANEVILPAKDLRISISGSHQKVLNRNGTIVLRFFEDRGLRVGTLAPATRTPSGGT